VKLPATDHADNHGATAVVTLRMTLVAQEPAESPHLPPQQPNPALSSQVMSDFAATDFRYRFKFQSNLVWDSIKSISNFCF
jgi:hypothetical protein